MDRRLTKRYQTDLAVTVIDLEAPERAAAGKIVDISQSGVCADLSLHLGVTAIVKIQTGDCVLFGHVIYSTVIYSDNRKSFRTGMEVIRVLIGESDLALLVNSILAEVMPATPGVRVNPVGSNPAL